MFLYKKLFFSFYFLFFSNIVLAKVKAGKIDSFLQAEDHKISEDKKTNKIFKCIETNFKKIQNKIDNGSDLDFGFGMSDLDTQEQLSTVPSLGIGVYYTGEKFRRIDQYRLSLSTDPLGVINTLPVYGLVATVNDFKYTSYYDSSVSAMSRPMHLNMIPPFSARRAKKMKLGDVFETNMTLNLAFGNTYEVPFLPTSFGFSHNTEIVVSGFFYVQIQSLDQNRVRVRISTGHDKSIGISDSFSPLIVVTEIDIINTMLSNFIYLNLLNLQNTYKQSRSKTIDYMFNLNNPKGIELYDRLFNKVKKWKKNHSDSIKKNLNKEKKKHKRRHRKDSAHNKIEKFKKNSHDLVSDLSELQQVVAEDKNLPVEKQRVTLGFKGDLCSLSRTSTLSIGLLFKNFSFSNNSSQYLIESHNIKDEEHDLYFQTYSSTRRSKYWFGIKPNFIYKEQFAFLDKDIKKQASKISVFGQSKRLRNHSFTPKKYKLFLKKLYRLLPKEIVKKIKVPKKFIEEKGAKSVLLTYKVAFSNDLFKKIRKKYSKSSDLNKKIEKYFVYLKKENLYQAPLGCLITKSLIKKFIKNVHELVYLENDEIFEKDLTLFLKKK